MMGQTTLNDNLRGIEAEIAAGRPEQALALSQELQTRYPRALSVQRVLGESYLALRKTREALGALDRVLAGNPEDARACCARAIVHQIHGDPKATLAWYRRACDISPDDKVLRSAYAELAASLGQPAYRSTRIGLARLYLRGDLFAHAQREWESLIAEQPDSLEAQLGLAETFWRARRFSEAEDQCRRILTNAASCVKAILILAAIEHDAGHADEAQRLVRRAFELDPDQRIARLLFADRFAAGDRALRTLMLGEEQAVVSARKSGPLSLPSLAPTAGAAAPTGRPFARSRPLSQPLGQPLPEQQQQQQQQQGQQQQQTPVARGYATGAPMQMHAPTAGPQPTPRPSALPDDFHKIFAETERMLWDDEPDEAARQAQLAQGQLQPQGQAQEMSGGQQGAIEPNAFERSRVDPFARSSLFVPPVLREQGASFDDTEARAAINWIQWLQAQGARARETAPLQQPPSLGQPTGPIPMPPMNGQPQPYLYGPSPRAQDWSQTHGPARTGSPTAPLPPPTPEQLRAMFAELDPETSPQRVVEGAIVEAAPAQEYGQPGSLNSRSATSGPQRETTIDAREPAPMEPPQQSGSATRWATPADLPEDLAELYAIPTGELPRTPASAPESAYGIAEAETGKLKTPAAAAGASSAADTTLEALEQGFAASGFEPIELHAGELASVGPQNATQGTADEPPAQPHPEEPINGLELHESNGSSGGSGELSPMAQALAAFAAPAAERGNGDTLAREQAQAATPTSADIAVELPPPVPVTTPKSTEPAPDDYPARLELARQRRADGRLDDALVEYRTLLKNAPDLLGEVIDDLHESMSDAPDHPEIHRLLGDARIRQGDYLSALESYNRAVSLTQAQGE